MSEALQRQNWFSVLVTLAIAVGALLFASGIGLDHTVTHCLSIGGRVAWQCYVRDVALLLCLPTVLLGFKWPRIASYALFLVAGIAALLAGSEMNSMIDFRADAIIALCLLLSAVLLHWRSSWVSRNRP
jgi:hypothetical protein